MALCHLLCVSVGAMSIMGVETAGGGSSQAWDGDKYSAGGCSAVFLAWGRGYLGVRGREL